MGAIFLMRPKSVRILRLRPTMPPKWPCASGSTSISSLSGVKEMGVVPSVSVAPAIRKTRSTRLPSTKVPLVELEIDEQVAAVGVLDLAVLPRAGAVGHHQIVGGVGADADALLLGDELGAGLRSARDGELAAANLEPGADLHPQRAVVGDVGVQRLEARGLVTRRALAVLVDEANGGRVPLVSVGHAREYSGGRRT